MDELIRFVMLAQSGRFTVSELCEQFGISRKAGYKHLERFAADGLKGLAVRSHRPHQFPHRTDTAVEALILANGSTAAKLMQSNALSIAKPHLNELMLQQGKKIRFPIMVSSTNQPVKATIVWTDPEGPNMAVQVDNAASDLINNVDLKVISPSGVTNFPWVLNADTVGESVALRTAAATKGTNNVDNVEQVFFWPTQTGLYTLEIGHQGNLQDGFQMVSLAVSGNNALAIPPLHFVNAYVLNQYFPNFVFTGVPGLTYRIEYLTNVTGNVWFTNSTVVASQTTNAVSVAVTDIHRFYRAVLVY